MEPGAPNHQYTLVRGKGCHMIPSITSYSICSSARPGASFSLRSPSHCLSRPKRAKYQLLKDINGEENRSYLFPLGQVRQAKSILRIEERAQRPFIVLGWPGSHSISVGYAPVYGFAFSIKVGSLSRSQVPHRFMALLFHFGLDNL